MGLENKPELMYLATNLGGATALSDDDLSQITIYGNPLIIN